MITHCSRTATSALRSSLQAQSRRYLEVNGAPPSKSGSNRLFGAGGIAAALVLGGAAYISFAGGADPKKLKETEDKLKAKLGVEKSDAKPESKGALGKEYRSFKLEKVTPYNHDTSIFRFKLPEGEESGLTVASALMTRAADEKALVNDKGKVRDARRTVTPPNEKGFLDLMIKKYNGGQMSSHIHGLKPGDELAMRGPLPKFPYKANEFEVVAFVLGGSGFTPGWQILQEIDSNPADKTKAVFIFANKTEKDILLKEKLDEIAKRKPDQFSVVYALDQPPSNWKGESGHLDAQSLGRHLPLAGLADKLKIFVCGPPGQVAALAGAKKSFKEQGPAGGALADLGYADGQIYRF